MFVYARMNMCMIHSHMGAYICMYKERHVFSYMYVCVLFLHICLEKNDMFSRYLVYAYIDMHMRKTDMHMRTVPAHMHRQE